MNKQIQFMNKIDEQGRFNGLEAHLVPISRPICDTHGYSYLHCREMYKHLGETMGLDKSVIPYMLEKYNLIRGIVRK